MSDALSHFTERLRQDRTAARNSPATPAARVAASPLLTSAGFLPGDRVFDTVSGQEGTVIDGTRQVVIRPAAGR